MCEKDLVTLSDIEVHLRQPQRRAAPGIELQSVVVPRQNSTGGKYRLGGISKRGNQYLRWL